MRTAAVLAMAMAMAFAVRVLPSYDAVVTAQGTNFQDNDSWFHMRSIHNLAAHFPRQSPFDPYSLYPAGEVLALEPWDTAVAGVAWVLGAGKPGPALIDAVGAWMPAVLGALLPLAIFPIARRLFDVKVALVAAVLLSTIGGTFLWETHLGIPDHHVAECWLTLGMMGALCAAVESKGRARWWRAGLAGLATGVYLCVRPAGIFVPGTLAIAALVEPLLAPLVAAALGIAWTVFLASSGSKWASFTRLSLAGSLAVCLMAWGMAELWRRKDWRREWLLPAAGFGVVVVVGLIALARPALFWSMALNIRRFLPGVNSQPQVNSIREVSPIWQVPPRGVAVVFELLGGSWVFAVAAMAAGAGFVWRARRPALTLATVWAVVMTIGGALQIRMLIFTGPVLAIAGAVGIVWFVETLFQARLERFRGAAVAGIAALVMVTALPGDELAVGTNGGPNSDWVAALDWLKLNTPEPMGTADAWLARWPVPKGGRFQYPASAYSVMTWWDYGDWVSGRAHRMTPSNGTQVGAEQVAGFLTATADGEARTDLGALGSQYVVLNSEVVSTLWPTILQWAKRDESAYQRKVYTFDAQGRGVPLWVYLPDYYRSMAVRMYVFGGRAVKAAPQVSVFTLLRRQTPAGLIVEVVAGERKFESAEAAYRYMEANTGETMVFGSMDPTASCVELEELGWAKESFASDSEPMRLDRTPRAVKVFKVQ